MDRYLLGLYRNHLVSEAKFWKCQKRFYSYQTIQ